MASARDCPCHLAGRSRSLLGVGSGLPDPIARTLTAGILPFARSMLASLRHPACARPATPAPGHRQPRAVQWIRGFSREQAGAESPKLVSTGGAADVPERAVEASGARMAKRSGHAVNGGLEGRSERPARRHRQPRRAPDEGHLVDAPGVEPALARPTRALPSGRRSAARASRSPLAACWPPSGRTRARARPPGPRPPSPPAGARRPRRSPSRPDRPR